MPSEIVSIDMYENPILESKGFQKKLLSDFHLEGLVLCQFKCRFCSTNGGMSINMHQQSIKNAIVDQLKRSDLDIDDPSLMVMANNLIENLERQLSQKSKDWGRGKTLIVSMLTDPFSPELLSRGNTKKLLEMVLEGTSFTIRILTKNAIVGRSDWLNFFAEHRDRFKVGLSIGTLDDAWAKQVEIGTPCPSSRIKALHELQDAGITTYGMVCPVFPHMLVGDQLEQLIDAMRPERIEHLWVEPFNDRKNAALVIAALEQGSVDHSCLQRIYEQHENKVWSKYATTLFVRTKKMAQEGGYLPKLRYLLYEGKIDKADAYHFAGFEGVLLQGMPRADGFSNNPHIAALQAAYEIENRTQ